MRGVAAGGPLLERSVELARIESALSGARTASARSWWSRGRPGSGRRSCSRRRGVLRQTAACGCSGRGGAELERDFAFGVARQLFEPSLAEASELERVDLLQAAAGVAAGFLGLPGAPPTLDPPASGVDPSFAILHGLYWLCANLAAARPLCVVVDDAHWADAAIPALPGLSAHAPPRAARSRFWWRAGPASQAPIPTCWRPSRPILPRI